MSTTAGTLTTYRRHHEPALGPRDYDVFNIEPSWGGI
jgi:hypothetical protein